MFKGSRGRPARPNPRLGAIAARVYRTPECSGLLPGKPLRTGAIGAARHSWSAEKRRAAGTVFVPPNRPIVGRSSRITCLGATTFFHPPLLLLRRFVMPELAEIAFAEHAARLGPPIESALDAMSRWGEGCPAHLSEAMRYSLLAPGKRVRPLLALMAAEACNGAPEAALPAAVAVEMVHAYSLIHDDLPAMDNDDLRRGRPTCHVAFGEATAILAGDGLLAAAFEVLATRLTPPEAGGAGCAVLAQAAGPCRLVGGQADDLDPARTTDLQTLQSIHQRKTGALIRAALRLGALSAVSGPMSPAFWRAASQLGSPTPISAEDDSIESRPAFAAEPAAPAKAAPAKMDPAVSAEAERRHLAHLAALDQYGARLGLAFQIVDDLLDVRGRPEAAGKRLGKDSAAGKLTYPSLLGTEAAERMARQLIDRAVEALAPLPGPTHGLESLARYVIERNR